MINSQSDKRLTRRRLLLRSGQLAAVGLLAGCTSPAAPLLFAQSVTEQIYFPKIPPLPVNAFGPAVIPEPSLDVKIGQMLLVGFRGRVITEESQIVQDIREHHIGSVVLFSYNIEKSTLASRQVKALTSALQEVSALPLFVTIDQEGGIVSRLNEAYGFPPTVSAAYLGIINDPEQTYSYAAATAQALAALGINLNLAPVVDLNTNPANPVIARYERSF
jgi:beta-N-acetylhexosaminidase